MCSQLWALQVSSHSLIKRRPCFGEILPLLPPFSSTFFVIRMISARYSPLKRAPLVDHNHGGLQDALVAGLDGYYRAFIASEADSKLREEAKASINTSLFSCIRPEVQGTVSSNSRPTLDRDADVTEDLPGMSVSGHVLPCEYDCREQKALQRGTLLL
jgi:hypothetical protein